MKLCQLGIDWNGSVPDGGVMVERKWDGIRALRFPGIDGVNRLWTRNGMVIEGTGHIAHLLDLLERAAGEPWFFDGEFVVDDSLATTKAWFERGWRLGVEAGVLHLFDGFPLRDWKAGGCEMPLYARKARLSALVGAAGDNPPSEWDWRPGSRGRDEVDPCPVQLVEDLWAQDHADVIDAARRVWAVDGEGLVAKDADAPYLRNRNCSWQKVTSSNVIKWRLAA